MEPNATQSNCASMAIAQVSQSGAPRNRNAPITASAGTIAISHNNVIFQDTAAAGSEKNRRTT